MQSYVSFLQHFNAMREGPSFVHLDPLEERLMNFFGLVWLDGQKISVLQAMCLNPEISGTTAHRRLKSLRKKGFIELVSDEDDNRIKYVVPTPQTLELFSQLGQCLQKAAARAN